jgi:alginate O-acetyltransferase complex protein AlgI
MLFNSVEFLVFFPSVTLLYFILPHRFRWLHLLIASCVFYTAFIPVYILILLFTIIVDYFAGMLIESAEGRKRKLFLVMSIIANVGVLAVFKYFNFLIDNMNAVLNLLHWNTELPFLSIILPIGLSFHTFQAMSYTIEVYRGRQKAERHFGIYALYVMFYPQLVAGPIERPQNLIHQFREEHTFDYDRVTSGLKLMMWGMFKKVVIADRLAVSVNDVYSRPLDFQGLPLMAATILFAFQIFCDFSGYSDIAIGSARVMGFKLIRNFDRPYFSKSISEFWKRWHISLSSWFRDYLYIALGGNRCAIPRWYLNLFIVFLVSGLWHGASWNFVIWGSLHGTFLVAAIVVEPVRNKVYHVFGMYRFPNIIRLWKIGLTFLLVTFAWIFFRALSFNDAWYIVTHLWSSSHSIYHARDYFGNILNRDLYGLDTVRTFYKGTDWILIFIAVGLMESVHWLQRNKNPLLILSSKPAYVRWLVYYSLGLSIIFFGVFEKTQFIYFQF